MTAPTGAQGHHRSVLNEDDFPAQGAGHRAAELPEQQRRHEHLDEDVGPADEQALPGVQALRGVGRHRAGRRQENLVSDNLVSGDPVSGDLATLDMLPPWRSGVEGPPAT